MADVYLDELGNNANAGTSWGGGNAKRDVSNPTYAGGDKVYARNSSSGGYTQTVAASTTLDVDASGTQDDPVEVFACKAATSATPPTSTDLVTDADDTDAAVYEMTAAAGSLTVTGSCRLFGWRLRTTNGNVSFAPATSVAMAVELEKCKLQLGTSPSAGRNISFGAVSATPRAVTVRMVDTDIEFGSMAGHIINVQPTGRVEMHGGSLTFGATKPTNLFSNNGGTFIAMGVDLSGWSSSATLATESNPQAHGLIHLIDCKVPSGLVGQSTFGTGSRSRVIIERCSSSTFSDSIQQYREDSVEGTVEITTTEYRTGGANDRTSGNAYAWKLSPRSSTVTEKQVRALRTPWLKKQVAGTETALTVRVAITGATEVQNDACWVEMLSGDETATPNTTALGVFDHSRCGALATAADLTDDGDGAWQGLGSEGTGHQAHKITFTIAPKIRGLLFYRVCYAPEATTVLYLDPQVEVA